MADWTASDTWPPAGSPEAHAMMTQHVIQLANEVKKLTPERRKAFDRLVYEELLAESEFLDLSKLSSEASELLKKLLSIDRCRRKEQFCVRDACDWIEWKAGKVRPLLKELCKADALIDDPMFFHRDTPHARVERVGAPKVYRLR